MSTIKVTYDPVRGLIQEYGEPTFTFQTGSTVSFDGPISYTPSDPDNWRPVPSDLVQAVDYLADTAHTTTLVFDISGSAGGNVHTNLDTLAAAAARGAGRKVVQIVVPNTLVSLPGSATGFVIPNGSNGPYNFGNCEFVVVNTPRTGNAPYIDFDDGIVFSELPYLFSLIGVSIRLPAGFFTTSKAQTTLRVDGASIFSKPSLTAGGCITVQTGHTLFASTNNLGAYSGWGDAPATYGLFDIAASGVVSIRLYDQGQVGLKTVSGAGSLSITMGDANCTCEAQTLHTGTFGITSPEHGLVVYNPAAGTSNNFRYNNWTVIYNVARGSSINLNRDVHLHVTGTTGAIPSGSWDLSNIILTGDPGSILTVQNNANLSSTTQLRVAGGLALRVDSGVLTSPFVWSSGTRTVQISDSSTINNLSSVPLITASGATVIRGFGAGNRYIPAASGSSILSAAGTVTADLAFTRAIQSQIELTANTVGLTYTGELQQKGSTAAGATTSLSDGSGNAFVRIPQYSTVLLQGTITARGTGAANAGTWTFSTMVTRDAAGSTVTAGGTAVAISATNYATAPAWALDAGSSGVRLVCTGAAASSSQWTANMTITAVGTGA
jgi:hypothetical protein